MTIELVKVGPAKWTDSHRDTIAVDGLSYDTEDLPHAIADATRDLSRAVAAMRFRDDERIKAKYDCTAEAIYNILKTGMQNEGTLWTQVGPVTRDRYLVAAKAALDYES